MNETLQSNVAGTLDVPSDVSFPQYRFYVYILFSLLDKGFYIGFTTDLRKRLTNHSKGEVTSTKFRRPFLLVHYEYFINSHDAKARERYLKSGYGRKQLAAFLQHTLEELKIR